MTSSFPDQDPARAIAAGLSRIGIALKAQSWQSAGPEGLTPTQGQVLALLQSRSPRTLNLGEVAQGLGISNATASEAVDALVKKRLIRKNRAGGDERRLCLQLSAQGERVAARIAGWSDFLIGGVEALSANEQTVFLRGVAKIIRTLQDHGRIAVARVCLTCQYFEPRCHDSNERPHHCHFVDSAFGDGQLRLDCPDHVVASSDVRHRTWERFCAEAKNRRGGLQGAKKPKSIQPARRGAKPKSRSDS